MEVAILKTIEYFIQFSYPPTSTDIYTFLSRKISKKGLNVHLESLIAQKKVIKSTDSAQIKRKSLYKRPDRYTLGGYSMYFKSYQKRAAISKVKLGRREWFVRMIAKMRAVRLIGYSGSLAMLNGTRGDDVDLFIITANNRLYTARFVLTLLAIISGVKRPRGVKSAPDAICMNLFFDENHLEVPSAKKNEYVAHEILQMMPYDIKGDIYERFIRANNWVFDLFPNRRDEYIKLGRKKPPRKSRSKNIVGNIIEQALKRLQLYFIDKHKTYEIVTDTQLWFFPKDYARKVKY